MKSYLTWAQGRKIVKNLASVKLAVVIISYLCVVIAAGTIVESRLDALAAKTYVYDSFWMYFGMGFLALSLIAVMVDRWPWKLKHAPFVLAHIGILFIILGSIFTLRWGLDGSMVINIGQSQRSVILPQTQVLVYASFGEGLTKVFEGNYNFLEKNLAKDSILVPTSDGDIVIDDFKPYVIPQQKVRASEDPFRGAALRFQITNDRFQQVDWLIQRKAGTSSFKDLGPLRVRLGAQGAETSELRNEIVLDSLGQDRLSFSIRDKDQKKAVREGVLKEGDSIELGWMGLKLKVLRYHPRAEEKWDIQERSSPTPLTISAVKVKFKGSENWVLLNDTLRLFSDSAAYFVSYVNQRLDIGFPIKLVQFVKEDYAGTRKAMSYKSRVEIGELGPQEITMNEPLKFQKMTFYQASFQEDDFGQPISSVLSVNYDPGRFFKYLGSLIMSVGIILLFYRRKTAKVSP